MPNRQILHWLLTWIRFEGALIPEADEDAIPTPPAAGAPTAVSIFAGMVPPSPSYSTPCACADHGHSIDGTSVAMSDEAVCVASSEAGTHQPISPYLRGAGTAGTLGMNTQFGSWFARTARSAEACETQLGCVSLPHILIGRSF